MSPTWRARTGRCGNRRLSGFTSRWGSSAIRWAATLSAQVKQLQFFAGARNYDSSLQAALDGNHVPVEVYHTLIRTVNDNLDQMHRYVALRRRLLGLDELHMYDVYAPLVEGVSRKIPFEEAKQTVYDALAPLGEDYRAILQEGYEKRWIDVYENAGKRSGAYSAGAGFIRSFC